MSIEDQQTDVGLTMFFKGCEQGFAFIGAVFLTRKATGGKNKNVAEQSQYCIIP